MVKNIILLSDGTGNSAGKVWRTNVWRVFEGLDLSDHLQVACYDDGVGTSAFKPLAVLGGAFGWGLRRNVLTLYEFLCRNYQPKDRIYGFGFSRGAYTIRVVTGLALSQGLVKGDTDEELHRNARLAYSAYRMEKFKSRWRVETFFRWVRRGVRSLFGGSSVPEIAVAPADVRITFLGLWDTVAAYGTPIDELTRGISKWIWPLELPDRTFEKERILRACHALSLDDERTTFHPVLWNEKGVPENQLTQVWFAGVHSNVGGGYPDDSLAQIPLYWIMQEVRSKNELRFKEGVSFDPDVLKRTETSRDKDGRLYDSRSGLGGYYRYGPRKLVDLCSMSFSSKPGDEVKIDIDRVKIHKSVIARAKSGAHEYAPIGIPENYLLVSDEGIEPQARLESLQEAANRCKAQEAVWNIVWQRRIVYFLTVFSTIYLVAYPLFSAQPSSAEYSTRFTMVSGILRLLGNVLPGIASTWIDAYARDPSHFVFVGGIVALLIYLGARLGTDIRSSMQFVWRHDSAVDQNLAYKKSLKFKIPLLLIPGAFVLLYPLVLLYRHFSFLHLPEPAHSWIGQYFTIPVCAVLFFLMLTYLLPPWVIYKLRSHEYYRKTILFLKLEFGPFLFAYGLALVVLLFACHVLFVVQETSGLVCHESDTIVNAKARAAALHRPTILANMGVGSCKPASIATCDSDNKPACGPGRLLICSDHVDPTCMPTGTKPENLRIPMCTYGPATCAPQCEEEHKILDTSSICNRTGVWLEEGSKYKLTVTQASWPWTDGETPANLRGYDIEDLDSWRDLFIATVIWPLKRELLQPVFRIVARIGATGSDEEFLIPEPISAEREAYLRPTKAGALAMAEAAKLNRDEADKLATANAAELEARVPALTIEQVIIPKISGELFLYVNDAALPGWGDFRRFFYRNNKGTAKVTITLLQ
ncbi:DUF2235 domain-containing protein [Bradyrhizobium sp. AZCC 2289]|uniref:DUF2235 domain-containing protein n=1 Tax=Bradyrhizobium sp. AZCC 2289 TaxID=3117026 RepID=UPI002FF19B38